MRDLLVRLTASTLTAAVVSGCFVNGIQQTARTAPPGRFEGGAGVDFIHIVQNDEGGGMAFLPLTQVSGRIGVSPNFDLGVYWATGPGLGGTAKWQLARGTVDVALMGRGSFYGIIVGGGGAGIFTLGPRIIVSSEAPRAFPFCLNGGVEYWGALAGDGGETAGGGTLLLCGGFGLPLRLGGTRQLRLMPELSVMVPTSSGVAAGGESFALDVEGLFASLGISLAFTGPYER